MTEYTPEKVAELVAEAKGLIAHTRTYNFGMWSADKLAHEVAGRLTDALTAVSADYPDAEGLHALRSEHDRQVAERAWDHCLTEIEKYEINTSQAREGNPYRKEQS